MTTLSYKTDRAQEETRRRSQMRVAHVGVPEVDALLRKIRKQEGFRSERNGNHLKVYGPLGTRPVSIPTSKIKATTLKNIKSKLRRKGFKIS